MEYRKTAQLRTAQGGRDIGHSIVEPEIHLLVVPTAGTILEHSRISSNAVRPQQTPPLRYCFDVRGDETAFAGRDDLHSVETKYTYVCVGGAYGLTAISSADCGTRILDDFELKSIRQRTNLVQIAGQASKVNWNHDVGQGARALCRQELPFKREHRHVSGRSVDIDEIDCGTAITGAVRRSDERIRRRP